MTPEQHAKQRFVDRKLTPMLMSATDSDVAGVHYWARGDHEEVELTFKGGHKVSVCVSCDSKPSIARDVLDALGKMGY